MAQRLTGQMETVGTVDAAPSVFTGPTLENSDVSRRGSRGIPPSRGSDPSPCSCDNIGTDRGAEVSEPRNEYADVRDMFRLLETLDADSAAYRRQRDAIIERTLPLAKHIAYRFKCRGEAESDLTQVACVGLINAVDRFDPDNGADFLAFAVPTIMGEVRRHFRDFAWAVKVPRRLKELHLQLTKAREELTQQLDRAPTASEIANHMGIDRESVIEATIASENYSTMSIDAQVGGNGERPVINETLGEIDAGYENVLNIETARPLIAALPAREQTVIRLRFFEEMSQTQIAQRMGYSQMHISRLLAGALDTLRDQILRADTEAAEVARTTTPAPPTRWHRHGAARPYSHGSREGAQRPAVLAS
jgi:RNA polymerase sigma-B factor